MAVYAVEGSWVAHQSNGFDVTFNLRRTDHLLLTGSATHTGGGQSRSLNGRLADNRIVMTVEWGPGSVGEYNGVFGVDDRLTGHTFDIRNPGSQATWFTTQGFVQVS